MPDEAGKQMKLTESKSSRSSRRPHILLPRRIWSGSEVRIWIWTPDSSGSRLLPNSNADIPVQGYTCDKIVMKIRSLSPEI